MKMKFRKALSLLCTVSLLLTSVPFSAYSDGEQVPLATPTDLAEETVQTVPETGEQEEEVIVPEEVRTDYVIEIPQSPDKTTWTLTENQETRKEHVIRIQAKREVELFFLLTTDAEAETVLTNDENTSRRTFKKQAEETEETDNEENFTYTLQNVRIEEGGSRLIRIKSETETKFTLKILTRSEWEKLTETTDELPLEVEELTDLDLENNEEETTDDTTEEPAENNEEEPTNDNQNETEEENQEEPEEGENTETPEENEEPAEEPADENPEEPAEGENTEEPSEGENAEPSEEGEELTEELTDENPDESTEEETEENPEEELSEETETEPEEDEFWEEVISEHIDDYTVTVTVTKEAEFPMGTTVKITPLNSTDYRNEAAELFDKNENELGTFIRAFDITFYYEDMEIEPLVPIDVKITFDNAVQLEGENELKLIHLHEEEEAKEIAAEAQTTEVAESENTEEVNTQTVTNVESLSFQSGQFSTYIVAEEVVVYTFTQNGNNYEVVLKYNASANIPENAVFSVEEITEESELYWQYNAQVAAVINPTGTVRMPALLDISLRDENGEKIQLGNKVQVIVRLTGDESLTKDLKVVHFPGEDPFQGESAVRDAVAESDAQSEIEVLDIESEKLYGRVNTTDNTVTFSTDSFSVFALAYTVDFYYGEFEYHLTGGGEMLLSELFTLLGIERNATDVINAEFTDASLLQVEKTENDWKLTSIHAFNTIEALTLGFGNGDTIVIRVEDNRSYKIHYNVNDPAAGKIHVAWGGSHDDATSIDSDVGDDGYSIFAVEPQVNNGFRFVGWLINGTSGMDGNWQIRPQVDWEKTYTACFAPIGETTGETEFIISYGIEEDQKDKGYLIQGDSRSYQFTYDNYGTTTTGTQYFNYTLDGKGATAVAKPGYVFDCWVDQYGNPFTQCTSETFEPYKVSGDQIAKPRFKVAPNVRVTYAVSALRVKVNDGRTYSNQGASPSDYEDIAPGTVPHGATAVNTSGGDYVFVGWKKDADFIEDRDGDLYKLTITEPVYSDTTYYGIFVKVDGQHILLQVNNSTYGYIYLNGDSSKNHTNTAQLYSIQNQVMELNYRHIASAYTGYKFDHWEVNGVRIADESIAGNPNIKKLNTAQNDSLQYQTLTAVFEPVLNVTYDMGVINQVGNQPASAQFWAEDIPWNSHVGLQGRAFSADNKYLDEADLNNYLVLSPSSYTRTTYAAKDGNPRYNLITHSFLGWRRSDTGAIVQPGDVLTDLAGPITLTAVWDAYFPESDHQNRYNLNSVGFFVAIVDGFDYNDITTYTDCLYSTKIYTVPDNVANPFPVRADFAGHSNGTDREITDVYLRNNATVGMTNGETTLRLANFPSDDFILGRIRNWLAQDSSRKIVSFGRELDPEDITTANFDIIWHVFKNQQNQWHIDGTLIRKYASLTVKKTFVGWEDAVNAAKNGYSITVQETNTPSNTYTLNLTGSEGAAPVKQEGNTYTWVLKELKPETPYTVIESIPAENNGTITVGDENYRQTASYRVSNSRPTSGDTGGAAKTVNLDKCYCHLDSETYEAYRTVAFTNLYTKPFVMTVLKQDGLTFHGLKNVTFDFVLKQGDTVIMDVPRTSDSNGHINIDLPRNEGNYSFTLTEREHEGYKALALIRGNVNVNSSGVVSLSNVQASVSGEDQLIQVDENDNSIIYVQNLPERKKVIVDKVWTDGTNIEITVQLLRDGVPVIGETKTLKQSNSWHCEWDDLPSYVDGKEVVYTVREEWIGTPGDANSAHYTPSDDADGYKEYIVNQSQTVTVTEVGGIKTTIVNVHIENTKDNGQLLFSKVDTRSKVVAGAVFSLYEDGGNQGGPKRENDQLVPYQNKTYTADSNGVVTINDLPVGDYWLKETAAPIGYTVNPEIYLVRISTYNSKIFKCDQNSYWPIEQIDHVVNEPFKVNIKVVKTGSSNSVKLQGAVFSLRRSILGVPSIAPMRGYEAMTTNAQGELEINNLESGTYFLVEETAPHGYEKLDYPVKIIVSDNRDHPNQSVTATINNVATTVTWVDAQDYSVTVPNINTRHKVRLRKVDSQNSSVRLEGVVFSIYTNYDSNNPENNVKYVPPTGYLDSDSMWQAGSQTFVSGSDGRFYIGYMPVGTYWLVEESTAEGYELLNGPIRMELTADQLTYTMPDGSSVIKLLSDKDNKNCFDINIPNRKLGALKITKTVLFNGSTPSGTDAARINGTYEFIINGTDTLTGNYQKNVKITFREGKPVSYQIDNGTPVTVNENGNAYSIVIPGLIAGTYTIAETIPTDGTTLTTVSGGTSVSANTVYITVVSGDTTAATGSAQAYFTNDYKTINITIQKVEKDNTTVLLSGAVFELDRKSGGNWVLVTDETVGNVNENGRFTVNETLELTGLSAGEYRIREVTAPLGYFITDPTPVVFTVTDGAVAGTPTIGTGVTYTAKSGSANDTFVISNTPGVELPSTGGSGTTIYTMLGLMLTLLAGSLLILRKRTMRDHK